MGLFDRFRKRVHEVAEETDGDALSVEATSQEAQALLNQQDPAPQPSQPIEEEWDDVCLLYTSPSPRDKRQSRMPSSA